MRSNVSAPLKKNIIKNVSQNIRSYGFLSYTSVHFEPGAVSPLRLFSKHDVIGHIVYRKACIYSLNYNIASLLPIKYAILSLSDNCLIYLYKGVGLTVICPNNNYMILFHCFLGVHYKWCFNFATWLFACTITAHPVKIYIFNKCLIGDKNGNRLILVCTLVSNKEIFVIQFLRITVLHLCMIQMLHGPT